MYLIKKLKYIFGGGVVLSVYLSVCLPICLSLGKLVGSYEYQYTYRITSLRIEKLSKTCHVLLNLPFSCSFSGMYLWFISIFYIEELFQSLV